MIAKDVTLAAGVVIHHPDLVNLYGCEVGEGTLPAGLHERSLR